MISGHPCPMALKRAFRRPPSLHRRSWASGGMTCADVVMMLTYCTGQWFKLFFVWREKTKSTENLFFIYIHVCIYSDCLQVLPGKDIAKHLAFGISDGKICTWVATVAMRVIPVGGLSVKSH